MNKHILKKIIAFVIVASLFVQILPGCTDIAMTTPDVTAGWVTDDPDVTDNQGETIDDKKEQTQTIPLSYDYHEHVGDIDTFVYGLFVSQYQLCYDVFSAKIQKADGSCIYGIGYTDYSCLFEVDDSLDVYFPCGFIALIGEEKVPDMDENSSIEIINLDNPLDSYKFVLAYSCDEYYEHCVIWGQYLEYGVDKFGRITYSTQPYERGKCNEKLGSLYSYDEQRFVYVSDVGAYTYISGGSLSSSIDYSELEYQVNKVLEEQDFNFSKVDIENAVYIAKDAVTSYLLSIQEETFLGCNVKLLIELAGQLDPMECVRITSDGAIIVDIKEKPPEEPTELAKWIVGAACFSCIAGSIALDVFAPWLSPLSGAVLGSSIEVFMQVVVENNILSNVNWYKVGISATTGALMAWACPALASGVTKG